MKCVVPNGNLNILSKCFHTLAKFGDSVYMEALGEDFVIQAVNRSKNAFGCFKFQRSFFTSYTHNGDPVKCKVALKSCFHAFKSLVLDKSVEECHLEVIKDNNEVQVQFHCKHNAVKTFKLPFTDAILLKADFSNENCINEIVSQSKLLYNCTQSFLSTVDEVTLVFNKDKVVMKNYTEYEVDVRKVVHTERRLEKDEFIKCEIIENAEVTFSLKELKAILSFTEGVKENIPVTISFNQAGEAIIFNIISEQGCQANFVLATLTDSSNENSQYESTGTSTVASIENERKTKTQPSKKERNLVLTHTEEQMKIGNELAAASAEVNVHLISGIDGAEPQALTSRPTHISIKKKTKLIPSAENIPLFNLSDDEDEPNNKESVDSAKQLEMDITVMDCIPASPPPAKRFKNIFLSKSKNSKYTSQYKPNDIVLAPDSDEETF